MEAEAHIRADEVRQLRGGKALEAQWICTTFVATATEYFKY